MEYSMIDDQSSDEFDTDNWDDDDPSPTIACSNCLAEIYEDSQVCPRCGEFQLADSRPWGTKPRWVRWSIFLIVLLLIFILIVTQMIVF
jgi:hypothetical protein